MASKGMEKIRKIKMVPIPEKIKVPSKIPASKVLIPQTYAVGNVEYEDNEGNKVNPNQASRLKFTSKDKRSDLTVGPFKEGGMFKLNIYMDDTNHVTKKEEATHKKQLILNEDYKAIRY